MSPLFPPSSELQVKTFISQSQHVKGGGRNAHSYSCVSLVILDSYLKTGALGNSGNNITIKVNDLEESRPERSAHKCARRTLVAERREPNFHFSSQLKCL